MERRLSAAVSGAKKTTRQRVLGVVKRGTAAKDYNESALGCSFKLA